MKFIPNENVLRVALVVFSIIFGILSIALITLGVIYVDELYWPRRFIGLDFLALPTLVLLLGSCSLILAIFGCLCAKSYNIKVFNIFIVFLVVILCMELTIAIICFENEDGLKDSEKHALKKDLRPEGYHEIEEHYKCCGFYGNETKCSNEKKAIRFAGISSDNLTKKQGCFEIVNNNLKSTATRMGYFSMGLFIFQTLQVFCASATKILMYE